MPTIFRLKEFVYVSSRIIQIYIMHACGLFSGVNAPNLKSSYTWLILSEKINLAIEIVTMLLRF